MNTARLGVIPFFGILVPGSYFAGVLFCAFASTLELFGLYGQDQSVAFVSDNIALSASVFFFISYLIGVLIRLFAPDVVDNLSTRYLLHIRQKKEAWVTDSFPYEATLTSDLTEDGMPKIPELMGRLNSRYGNKDNKHFLNYCKWFIDTNDPALSREIHEAEALVRFLSGTTFALLSALVLSAIFLVLFWLRGSYQSAVLYGGLLLTAMLSLCLILERFKYQRRREVLMVWSCVYLIINGGMLTSTPGKALKKMRHAVFFPEVLQNNDSNREAEESSPSKQ
jgi:hypothetical protein